MNKINWQTLKEEAWKALCSIIWALFVVIVSFTLFLVPIILTISTQNLWYLSLYIITLFIVLTISNYKDRMK